MFSKILPQNSVWSIYRLCLLLSGASAALECSTTSQRSAAPHARRRLRSSSTSSCEGGDWAGSICTSSRKKAREVVYACDGLPSG